VLDFAFASYKQIGRRFIALCHIKMFFPMQK